MLIRNQSTPIQRQTIDQFLQSLISELELLKIDKTEFIRDLFNHLSSDLEHINDFTTKYDIYPHTHNNLYALVRRFHYEYGFYKTDNDNAGTQTNIREILFNYINPFNDFFNIKNLDTKTISLNNFLEENGDVSPNKIANNIVSFTDYKSGLALRQTCKLMYFQQKALQDRTTNLFYTLGSNIKTTKQRNANDTLVYTAVPSNEIMDSINHKNLKNIKLFKSLYQAVEYARSKHVCSEVYDLIPSLWMVSYVGNPNDLKFTDQIVIINAKNSLPAENYSQSRCKLKISSSYQPKKSILPLIGTVVFPKQNFAEYDISEKVDFLKYIQAQNQQLSTNNKIK